MLACAAVGAIAVMVDGGLPPATVDRFGEITNPAAILIAPGCRLQRSDLPSSLREIPAFDVTIVAGAAVRADKPVSDPSSGNLDGADHPLAMIFTSGTTGTPKAVLLPNRTFYSIADILQREQLTWVDWVVGETTYSPLPATHIGGLWWILNCLMQGGLCITGGETSASIAEILTANDVATTCLVPTLLTRLVAELRAAGKPVPPALRMVGYGDPVRLPPMSALSKLPGFIPLRSTGSAKQAAPHCVFPPRTGRSPGSKLGRSGGRIPAWRSTWTVTAAVRPPGPPPVRHLRARCGSSPRRTCWGTGKTPTAPPKPWSTGG